MNTNKIKVIAFDADDTLWDNQTLYDATEDRYCEILAPYGNEHEIRKALFNIESNNMPNMGYGAKAFLISLVQNALIISNNTIPASALNEILKIGMKLLQNPAIPFEGIKETLTQLRRSDRYKMICFTKGELIDQENKFNRSGLAYMFDGLEIVSDKTPYAYMKLLDKINIQPEEFMMIGNSFKSDIHPVIKIGGYGIHIPYKRMWQYEHIEEYKHDRVIQVTKFEDILKVLR